MVKYDIVQVEHYPESGPNDKVTQMTLITFHNEANLLDSIIIPSSEYTPANTDSIIDKALKERK